MRPVLLSLVLALAGAGPAAAAEVKVVPVVLFADRGGDPSYAYVELHGAAGEANTVTVTGGREALVVRDASAPVSAGPGCRALDARAVKCRSPYPPIRRVHLHGEDGDDALTDAAPGISGELFGGPGDDVLTGDDWQRQDGGDGTDRLVGGARADTLQGGAGRDEVHAGGDMDRVLGDPAGAHGWPDVLDGGAGRDTVSYEGRTTEVTIDLGTSGPQGAVGERDVLSGFESASGGDAADVVRGTDGPNFLGGSGGHDLLVGRGGRDQLLGMDGDDRLEGGAGADWMDGTEGSDVYIGGVGDDTLFLSLSWYSEFDDDARAAVACGPGRDVAVDPDEHTLVPRDCERISFDLVALRVIRAGPRRLVLGLVAVRTEACRLTARVTRAGDGRELARRVVRPGRRTSPRIDLRWQQRIRAPVLVRLRARGRCRSDAVELLGDFKAPPRADVSNRLRLAGGACAIGGAGEAQHDRKRALRSRPVFPHQLGATAAQHGPQG